MVIPNIEIIFISHDDNLKLVETLGNKNDFYIRHHHCFIPKSGTK